MQLVLIMSITRYHLCLTAIRNVRSVQLFDYFFSSLASFLIHWTLCLDYRQRINNQSTSSKYVLSLSSLFTSSIHKHLQFIPIESFAWKHRQWIVQMVVLLLNSTIFSYNKLFRCSNIIMRLISVSIFLFVYSIIPCITFAVSVQMTSYLLDITLSELYYLSLQKRSLFVSFGVGFLMFYVAEIAVILWFEGTSGIDAFETYLIRTVSSNYSKFIHWTRNVIICMYRETGWDVLQLTVKQQLERRYALDTVGKEYHLPNDIVGLIDGFLFDDGLFKLSTTRKKERNDSEEDDETTPTSYTTKPYDIFQMYLVE
eukprot:143751_1